jgi:hypothetical protein
MKANATTAPMTISVGRNRALAGIGVQPTGSPAFSPAAAPGAAAPVLPGA